MPRRPPVQFIHVLPNQPASEPLVSSPSEEPAWKQRAVERSIKTAKLRAAQRVQRFLDRTRDFFRETFLHLEPPRVHVDEARKLGQADDPSVRDVRHVHLTKERKHVVLAQTIELDISNEHHVFMRLFEDRVADDIGDL